jgi:predicted transcriptional regulator
MTVKEIAEELNLEIFSGNTGIAKKVTGGYTSDLLSDVMGKADAGKIWITLQTHQNSVAVASLKDLAAIILVHGFKPEEDAAKQSDEEKIPILGTQEGAFEISGRLFKLINK